MPSTELSSSRARPLPQGGPGAGHDFLSGMKKKRRAVAAGRFF
ncbi:hypothetical protein RK21_00720 [Pseudomonas plecoglossicida]|nr:hypothetical protein RK21_00720 [Pseudomonas plecoglossicida]